MKKFALFAFILTLVCVAAKAQQTAVAPGKKAVIAEIIAATNADKKGEETMLAMFKQLETMYPQIIEGTIEKTLGNLPAAEKQKIKAEVLQKTAQTNAKFVQRLQQRLNLREYVETAIYPLYDKFFTESELRELLAFYKTPIGRKLNDISPEMAVEGVRLAQELLVPKMMTIFDEIVQEDIKEARKTAAPNN